MLTKLVLSILIALSANRAIAGDEGSPTAVQHRINMAAPGSVVTIPAGSFTWSQEITISKGITLQGAGPGVTTIKNAS
jgi:hypothetical protein